MIELLQQIWERGENRQNLFQTNIFSLKNTSKLWKLLSSLNSAVISETCYQLWDLLSTMKTDVNSESYYQLWNWYKLGKLLLTLRTAIHSENWYQLWKLTSTLKIDINMRTAFNQKNSTARMKVCWKAAEWATVS